MPGRLSGALKKAAFMAISLLLLPAPGAGAGEDFESGLREGRRHGAEMLSRHSQSLKPSAVEEETLPGYGTETREELQTEGARWTGDPEGMRTEADGAIRGGDPATSDAAGFLKRSSEQRPAFTIDPKTDPVIAGSRNAIENPLSSCEKKETCTEYTESSWNEQKECYSQATLSRHLCNVKKTVTVTVIPQETEITYEIHIETEDGCGGYRAAGNCETFSNRCLKTTRLRTEKPSARTGNIPTSARAPWLKVPTAPSTAPRAATRPGRAASCGFASIPNFPTRRGRISGYALSRKTPMTARRA